MEASKTTYGCVWHHLEVIPLAENVIKLTAVCSDCHKSASFTKRLTAETDIQVSKASGLSWTTCNRMHGLIDLCKVDSQSDKLIFLVSKCLQHTQVVGGADKYTALCRTCFQKPNAHPHAHRGSTDCAALLRRRAADLHRRMLNPTADNRWRRSVNSQTPQKHTWNSAANLCRP